MQIMERYLTISSDGQRILSGEKPEGEYKTLYQLTAKEGKLLINGVVGLRSVETYDPSVWYEVDDPGDDRYNVATAEDYREMLRAMGVDV